MSTGVTRSLSVVIAVLGPLCGCAGAPPEPSATPRTGSVWVADEGHDSITVIDVATAAVATTLTGISAPHNVQAARDGAVVYAVSGAGVVVAIDPLTYRVSAAAPTGKDPAHVIEAPNGKVYVTDAGDATVSVYTAPGLTPAGRIRLDGMPHGLRAAAGGSVIVVANTGDGALNLIDPATDTVLGTVPVGPGPAQVAVSADARYAYTGISEPPSVVKVDLAQRKVVGSTAVPHAPVQLYLTPDETSVVSADQGRRDDPGDTLSIIDTATMSTRGTVTTGSGPHGVAVDGTGDWAWVTNSYDDTVTAVNLPTLSAMATVPVGSGPNGISYSPRPPATPPGAVVTLDIPVNSAPSAATSKPDQHAGHH